MSFAEQLAARAGQQRRAAPSPEPPAAPPPAASAASSTAPRRDDGATEDGRRVSFEEAVAATAAPPRPRRTPGDGGRRGSDHRLLKAENKKLRMEALLLKAKLELREGGEEDAGREEAAEAREAELRTRCERLERRLQGEELSRQQLTSDLAQVTEAKNAEIEVLRAQLHRAETQAPRTGRDPERERSRERAGLRDEVRRLNVEIGGHKKREEEDEEARAGLRDEIGRLNVELGGHKEREEEDKEARVGLRDEIRRLNVELGSHKEREEEDEEISFMSRYNKSNGDWSASQPSRRRAAQRSHESDRSDVASLQSIVAVMRQTIDRTTQEKDLLERRLGEEQARSQLELQAFARTLAGVDDLRAAAEGMSREIRRLRVRGCRPHRPAPLGADGPADGGDGRRGDPTAAVAASDAMEDALRVIEGHGEAREAREERRRAGSAAGAADTAGTGAAAPRADDGGGGFLSFWRRASSNDEDAGGPGRERKAKHKQKRKGGDSGSVLTSFF